MRLDIQHTWFRGLKCRFFWNDLNINPILTFFNIYLFTFYFQWILQTSMSSSIAAKKRRTKFLYKDVRDWKKVLHVIAAMQVQQAVCIMDAFFSTSHSAFFGQFIHLYSTIALSLSGSREGWSLSQLSSDKSEYRSAGTLLIEWLLSNWDVDSLIPISYTS